MSESHDRYLTEVTERVGAPPAAVFALLSDPQRHPDIDGSGTVLSVRASESPLRVGSTFDMAMRRGFPYVTRNTVVALTTDRVVAWSTSPLTKPLSWLIGGRVWRYELEPDAGGTSITASRDMRPEHNRRLVSLAGEPSADLRATIRRIGELAG